MGTPGKLVVRRSGSIGLASRSPLYPATTLGAMRVYPGVAEGENSNCDPCCDWTCSEAFELCPESLRYDMVRTAVTLYWPLRYGLIGTMQNCWLDDSVYPPTHVQRIGPLVPFGLTGVYYAYHDLETYNRFVRGQGELKLFDIIPVQLGTYNPAYMQYYPGFPTDPQCIYGTAFVPGIVNIHQVAALSMMRNESDPAHACRIVLTMRFEAEYGTPFMPGGEPAADARINLFSSSVESAPGASADCRFWYPVEVKHTLQGLSFGWRAYYEQAGIGYLDVQEDDVLVQFENLSNPPIPSQSFYTSVSSPEIAFRY